MVSVDVKHHVYLFTYVNRCKPVWPSGKAGKRKDLGSIPLRLSFLFKKVVVCGYCPVPLSITSYWNIKMALVAAHLNAAGNHSGSGDYSVSNRYIRGSVPLPPPPYPFPPFSPSLMSLMVSVDVNLAPSVAYFTWIDRFYFSVGTRSWPSTDFQVQIRDWCIHHACLAYIWTV